jgi:hypothetical protein
MKNDIVIEVNDVCRIKYDGYSYQPELFDAGGEEVRNPATGEIVLSKPKWKSCQKWYGKISNALYYVAEQTGAAKKQDYVSIKDWAKHFESMEQTFAEFSNVTA